MFRYKRLILMLVVLFLASFVALYARQSYEDYRGERNSENYNSSSNKKTDINKRTNFVEKDKPLSEINAGERDEFIQELRKEVKDEIDKSLRKERKAKKKKINKDEIISDVKKIVKDEINNAILVKQKKYLARNTLEFGGFISFFVTGLNSDSTDNNWLLQVFPVFNWLIIPNVALAVKGEITFNITTGTQQYVASAGPMFTFGVNKADTIVLYAAIYGGISYNSALTNKLGFRFINEFGIKFIFNPGVALTLGVQVIFDNAGDNITGFQNLYMPAIGVTAWL